MLGSFRCIQTRPAVQSGSGKSANRKQFNRRWLQLSRKCHANGGKRWQKYGKRQQRKEKAGCGNLPQLAEFVRLATPLARFGKIDRTASKQGVASSSLAGRATSLETHSIQRSNRDHSSPVASPPIICFFDRWSETAGLSCGFRGMVINDSRTIVIAIPG